MISEAEKRLRKLESERLRLDHELRCTREKIVMSERGKELIEARMKVKSRTYHFIFKWDSIMDPVIDIHVVLSGES